MEDLDLRVTFASRTTDMTPPSNSFSSSEVSVEITCVSQNLIRGRYQYESNPKFGTSESCEGAILFDKSSSLFAITTNHDRPKASKILRKLDDALNTTVETPNITASSQHSIYKEYCFGQPVNGHTITFKEKQTDYMTMGTASGSRLDPEDEAKEIKSQGGDTTPHDVAEKAIDAGMFIWSADLSIDGQMVSFSDPLRFIGVEEEWAEDGGFRKLFEISRRAVQ